MRCTSCRLVRLCLLHTLDIQFFFFFSFLFPENVTSRWRQLLSKGDTFRIFIYRFSRDFDD